MRDLGNSKNATIFWWHQRLTSLFLIPLFIFFIQFVKKVSNSSIDYFIDQIQKIYNIVPLMILIIIALYHSKLGMQMVLEEYVSNIKIRNFLLISLQLFIFITMISSLVSLLYLFTL